TPTSPTPSSPPWNGAPGPAAADCRATSTTPWAGRPVSWPRPLRWHRTGSTGSSRSASRAGSRAVGERGFDLRHELWVEPHAAAQVSLLRARLDTELQGDGRSALHALPA